MQILIKIGLNPAELWPKPFLLGQLLFDFPCLLGQLLAGPSIRKPGYLGFVWGCLMVLQWGINIAHQISGVSKISLKSKLKIPFKNGASII